MRRKPGTLLPLEASILTAALELNRAGVDEFHGFALASELREVEGARRLTAHGTLYKALDRLERSNGARRRLYELTSKGRRALERTLAAPGPARLVPLEGLGSS
jgi:PadR family transcriptional regulator, regulatory protein PadR